MVCCTILVCCLFLLPHYFYSVTFIFTTPPSLFLDQIILLQIQFFEKIRSSWFVINLHHPEKSLKERKEHALSHTHTHRQQQERRVISLQSNIPKTEAFNYRMVNNGTLVWKRLESQRYLKYFKIALTSFFVASFHSFQRKLTALRKQNPLTIFES